jgi:hypothetical protein
MKNGIQVVGLYVHDQDEALQFYVEKLGFRVHTDARNGDYRWLTVQHPDQPDFQLGLFRTQAPTVDEATAQDLNEAVAKGAMPPLVLMVEDCQKPLTPCTNAASNSPRNQSPVMARWMRVSAILQVMAGSSFRRVEATIYSPQPGNIRRL